MLAVTGQPSGSNVYATIEAADGTVYQAGSFSAYASLASAARPLAETPAGSLRYRAALPALPDGVYEIAYYLRAGTTPAVTDRLLGSETITVGSSTAQVAINVLPLTVDVVGPKDVGQLIQIYQNTADALVFGPITDCNGAPVDLTGKAVRFILYEDGCQQRVLWQLDSGTGFTSPVTISASTVTVQLNAAITAKQYGASYVLRNLTDATVLATGVFYVSALPTGV